MRLNPFRQLEVVILASCSERSAEFAIVSVSARRTAKGAATSRKPRQWAITLAQPTALRLAADTACGISHVWFIEFTPWNWSRTEGKTKNNALVLRM